MQTSQQLASASKSLKRLTLRNFDEKFARIMAAMGMRPPGLGGSIKERIGVPLSADAVADIELIAELWNAVDAAHKERRVGGAWKPPTVLRALVENQLADFWTQIGGRPATNEARAEFVRRGVAALKQQK
jgi:hypothetical protein